MRWLGRGARHRGRDGEGRGCRCGCGGVETERSLSLDEAPVGGRVVIRRLNCRGAIRQRLIDIGLAPGVTVTLMRAAPLNDPIEVGIGRAFVSLRRAEAAEIEVSLV